MTMAPILLLRRFSAAQLFLLLVTVVAVADARISSSPSTTTNNNNNETACERLGELPEECHCQEPGHRQVKIRCLKPFESVFFNDTIGLLIDIDPCNGEGSKMDVDLIEVDRNIEFTVADIHAGDEHNFPIPGLSVVVPGIGHIGVDLAVLIEGNPDMLKLKIGLDACVALSDHQICASSIPGLNLILPWYVLSGTYTFGDYCGTNTTTTTTTTTSTVIAKE